MFLLGPRRHRNSKPNPFPADSSTSVVIVGLTVSGKFISVIYYVVWGSVSFFRPLSLLLVFAVLPCVIP